MSHSYMIVEQSQKLSGTIDLIGAKNAVLVTIASLILTSGKSVLTNVPFSDDVMQMMKLLQMLGAEISYSVDEHRIEVDTSTITKWQVSPDIMRKMRASILVMGPLLARFGKAHIASPGGCVIGSRPIDYHLKGFKKMGVIIDETEEYLNALAARMMPQRIVLEYPSVGATENIMMATTMIQGITTIVNAALEPEVLDLISVLKKMGAKITIEAPATIHIEGVASLQPITHAVIADRLEAGALLLSAAISGGEIFLPQCPAYAMDVFLLKLEEMGHELIIGNGGIGVTLRATQKPKAVSFKTSPYPGFPTDLQAPMMAALCLAEGTSIVEETVFENRLLHARELQKMGAQIKVEGAKAAITGVDELYGGPVIATDIRASCALVLAGFSAKGSTIMTGIHHWTRGYDGLEKKLQLLGGKISLHTEDDNENIVYAKPEVTIDQIQRN